MEKKKHSSKSKRNIGSIAGSYIEQKAGDVAIQFGHVDGDVTQSTVGSSISFVGRDHIEGGSHVNIGNVSGGITNSVIAGRDVSNVTISVGGKAVQADKEPTLEELQQLLAEVQQDTTDIVTQKEHLGKISAATPYTAMGAEANIKEVIEKIDAGIKPEETTSIGEKLTESAGIFSNILDGAKNLIQKSVEVGESLKPVMEKLGPVVDKITVAALWVGKLWPK